MSVLPLLITVKDEHQLLSMTALSLHKIKHKTF